MVNLLVEGLTDAAFFQHLVGRLYLQGVTTRSGPRPGRENIPASFQGTLPDGTLLEVNLTIAGGRPEIQPTTGALLRRDVTELVVAQDIDDGSPEQVVESIRDSVYDHLGLTRSGGRSDSRRIEVAGRTVYVIPMGLYQDDSLRALGITHHALEDYLIRFLLEDAELRQRAPELRGLLSEILPTVRRYDGPFNSSKELFQLIKPIIQHGFSDVGVVQKLIEDSEIGILQRVVSPLLEDLDQVFGIQSHGGSG